MRWSAGAEPSLGIILEYPGGEEARLRARTVPLGGARGRGGRSPRPRGLPLPPSRPEGAPAKPRPRSTPSVSFIGAGNYATGVLIPAFKAAGAVLRTVASSGGVSGVHAGRKFGFERTTTDTEALFADAGTAALVITTRHDSHARLGAPGAGGGQGGVRGEAACV
jgi:hypothetical protein